MATSDEELADKRAHVQELREQVAAEEAKRLEREAGVVNDLASQQLDAEAARLEAQLAQAKLVNTSDSTNYALDAAKAATKAAEEQKAAVEGRANESQEG